MIKEKKKGLMNEERGSFAYFVVFVILALTLMFLFAVGIPMLISFDTEFYKAGNDILVKNQDTINNIQDANARAVFNQTNATLQGSISDQVDVLSVFFQYGWIIVVLVIVLILFLGARQQVESGSGLR